MQCVTCHVEHRPEITLPMGVTLAADFCAHCHQDIAKDRPSHKGMAFNTCNSAGCHKFHDNRALYEDFLAKHLNEPAQQGEAPQLPARNFREVAGGMARLSGRSFPSEGTNRCRCAARIHARAQGRGRLARDGTCAFRRELQRLPQGGERRRRSVGEAPRPQGVRDLPRDRRPKAISPASTACGSRKDSRPMTPRRARQPMHAKAGDNRARMRELPRARTASIRRKPRSKRAWAATATSTRKPTSAHRITRYGRKSSPARPPAGSGVSCATCHLPREEYRAAGRQREADSGAAQPERQPAAQRKDDPAGVHELPRPWLLHRRARRQRPRLEELSRPAPRAREKRRHGCAAHEGARRQASEQERNAGEETK